MYSITKRMEVSAAHKLNLPYESKCKVLHGHNWIVEITIDSLGLNAEGMVVDFTHLKTLIQNWLDHQDINSVFDLNPTCENLCHAIAIKVNSFLEKQSGNGYDPYVVKVQIQESEGNVAVWRL